MHQLTLQDHAPAYTVTPRNQKQGKENTTHTLNTRDTERTDLANRTIYTLIWYALYDL